MGLFLNFGAGLNQLPEPWQNLNAEHDIRKRLKFQEGSAAFILAEHVIEHVPFLQGFGFLQECRRVLEPGGVLRLAFPDVGRFLASVEGPRRATQWSGDERIEFNDRALRYARALELRDGGSIIRNVSTDAEKIRAGQLLLLAGWHHEAAWTERTAAGALLTVGFLPVVRSRFRLSEHPELAGADGHHKDVGEDLAEMETTVLEATK